MTIPVVAWSARRSSRAHGATSRFGASAWTCRSRWGSRAAFAASAWSTLGAGGPVYYDSVTMFVALLLCARYVELVTRQRAGEAIERAARALPPTAERYEAWPGARTETVDAATLAPGDVVLVRAGATIPADGTVVDGSALVEEAMLTGESCAARARRGRPRPRGFRHPRPAARRERHRGRRRDRAGRGDADGRSRRVGAPARREARRSRARRSSSRACSRWRR